MGGAGSVGGWRETKDGGRGWGQQRGRVERNRGWWAWVGSAAWAGGEKQRMVGVGGVSSVGLMLSLLPHTHTHTHTRPHERVF